MASGSGWSRNIRTGAKSRRVYYTSAQRYGYETKSAQSFANKYNLKTVKRSKRFRESLDLPF